MIEEAGVLTRGSSCSSRTQEGQTALQLAISSQLPLVVDAICTRGADMSVVDEKGNPPLWLALEKGLEDIASTLVRHTHTHTHSCSLVGLQIVLGRGDSSLSPLSL